MRVFGSVCQPFLRELAFSVLAYAGVLWYKWALLSGGYMDFDWERYNAMLWFGTGLGLYLMDKFIRKYRPTKRVHDYLWRTVKNERLRKILFWDL
jgi:hypothetical protein